MTADDRDAIATAEAIRRRETTAQAVIDACLERIRRANPRLNCFTEVLTDSARADAERVDRAVAAGDDPGPLAGVPFAVKNLFDVAGLTTLAGSTINRDRPAAVRDAAAVRALRRAGAVLVGALNMDEYAYGFTTENTHYGPTRNPHDPTRVAGGSSGGSGAAVAARLVPLALGSDTNGSIRVPAALCGVFGLKPTYGRVSRAGTELFSWSFDHVGPLARSARDLAIAFDLMHGHDPDDPVSSRRPVEPTLPRLGDGIGGLRIAAAGDHFARAGEADALAAARTVTAALGATREAIIPECPRARFAAMLITASEAASLHLPDLRRRPKDFDPITRDRFIAGAFVPGAAYAHAQRFRRWFRDRVRDVFREVDVLVTATTPYVAQPIGTVKKVVDGVEEPARRHLGVYTQPFSFIGLPALTIPVRRDAGLPLGVQLVAAPYREADLLRVAAWLEARGLVAAPVPKL
jgi:AtzE family amidohydrolase